MGSGAPSTTRWTVADEVTRGFLAHQLAVVAGEEVLLSPDMTSLYFIGFVAPSTLILERGGSASDCLAHARDTSIAVGYQWPDATAQTRQPVRLKRRLLWEVVARSRDATQPTLAGNKLFNTSDNQINDQN